MYLETVSGAFIEVSRHYIENAPRHQLVEYLEMRGTACFDSESTEELRECALEDFKDEQADYDYTASPYDLSHCRR